MIRRFNTQQILLGIFCLLLSILAYVITFWFFHFGFLFVTYNFNLKPPEYLQWVLPFACLAVVTGTGIARHRSETVDFDYEGMDPYAVLQPESGGAFMVARYASQVTGPAYLVSRIALAAPLRLLQAIDRFQAIVKPDAQLEADLGRLLEQIKSVGKWQDVATYHGRESEISLLIRMNLLDYSPRTGKMKAK